jgi:hypothetical protein
LAVNRTMPKQSRICQIETILLFCILIAFGFFLRGFYLDYSTAWQIFCFFSHFLFLNMFVAKYWPIYSRLENEKIIHWLDRIVVGELENWFFLTF